MASDVVLASYTELLEYLVERVTPEELLAFRVSEALQDQLQDLVDPNNEGTLTPEEMLAIRQLLDFDDLVSTLKIKALKAQKQP